MPPSLSSSQRPRINRHLRKRIALVMAGILVILCAAAYGKLATGAKFLVRYMDRESPPDIEIEERRADIRGLARTIPVKLFVPADGFHRVVLVVHGVHWKGYDEPRLLHFARTLASMGIAVAAPDIEDLKNYQLEPRAVDEIEASALWLLNDSGLESPDGKIGILGISFAGGLGISAAARESLAGRVAYLFSFGGHGDLDRTLEYLIDGVMPDGGRLPPHVYGQAVVIRFFADRLVPLDQVDRLRAVLFDYLRDEKKAVRAALEDMKPESRRLVELCLERDVDTLGKILDEEIGGFSTDPCLSPVKGEPPDCPVFLLHGSVDNVIPPSESVLTGRWAREKTDVTVLVSELIKHVDLDSADEEPPLSEYVKALLFWNELLVS